MILSILLFTQGIPTANLCRSSSSVDFDVLPTGIYWGFASVLKNDKDEITEESEHKSNGNKNNQDKSSSVYKTAVSIGYNPTYGNTEKTVEPHFISPPNHPSRTASLCSETLLRDFYDDTIHLTVVGYLRPELPFEGLDKLIKAIKQDIVKAELLCDGDDENTNRERIWAESFSSKNQ
eukprot:CAMPEP_0171314052 /NCGR_PEP_ID=MMETSP0816-20121228/48194_1 /TAXON_ID=420281 /ORGANISM="Proboscia inermis, Strain CCAP1064/1" /LENGTH=177 /DNA_ID=CAMNT_0011802403 /DNA_START=71 /DNA_END=604 /DNA_ORIENTATION=-